MLNKFIVLALSLLFLFMSVLLLLSGMGFLAACLTIIWVSNLLYIASILYNNGEFTLAYMLIFTVCVVLVFGVYAYYIISSSMAI